MRATEARVTPVPVSCLDYSAGGYRGSGLQAVECSGYHLELQEVYGVRVQGSPTVARAPGARWTDRAGGSLEPRALGVYRVGVQEVTNNGQGTRGVQTDGAGGSLGPRAPRLSQDGGAGGHQQWPGHRGHSDGWSRGFTRT